MALRIGRLEAGEVEDSDIDGGERDIGGLARDGALDVDADGQRLARVGFGRRLDRDVERAVARGDGGMGEAERAGRIAAGGSIHRAQDRGGDIGTGGPVIGHGKGDEVLALGDRHGPERDHPVREDRDERDAGGAGHEAQRGGIARGIGGRVERQVEQVGRGGGIGGDVPAGREVGRGGDIGAVAAFDDDFVAAPGRGRRHGDGGVAERCGTRGDAGAGGRRLPVPVAVEHVPLVGRLDAVDGPGHLHRRGRKVGRDGDEVEGGGAAFGHDAVTEGGADPDHREVGRDRQGQAAFDRAARAFGHAHGECGGERLAHATLHRRHDERQDGRAIRAGLARERLDPGVEGQVVAAEAVTGEGLERGGAGEHDLALDGEVGGGGAEEPVGRDREFAAVAQGEVAPGLERHVDAFGQEILDQHRLGGKRGGVDIGVDGNGPAPARGVARDRQRKDMAARAVLQRGDAGIFDAVGAGQDRGERQARQGAGSGVAHQSGEVDRLARAVGAAVGGEEDVDRRGGFAPLDPAVGEVEGGIGQRQEGHVARRIGHGHERGLRRAGAADQAGLETGDALGIGQSGAEHGIAARQERDLGPLAGAGIGQRADDDGQAVVAAEGREAEVGEDEPLRRGRRLVGVRAGDGGGQDIDARGFARQRLGQGQTGEDVAVEVLCDGGAAVPDRLADRVLEGIALPVVERLGKEAVLHGAQDVAVRDAEEAEIDLGQVHRLDRERDVAGARQDIGAAREADGGAAVADIEREFDRPGEGFAAGRGQARAQDEPVAFAMRDTVDAELGARDIDGKGGIGQLDEGGIVHPRLHEVFGEVGADARRRGIAVDLGVGDAEAVKTDRAVERGLGLAPAAEIERKAQRGHAVAAAAVVFERGGHVDEDGRAQRRIPGTQVGVDEGGQRAALHLTGGGFVGTGEREGEATVFVPEIGAVGQGDGGTRQAEGGEKVALRAPVGGGGKQVGAGLFVGGVEAADPVGEIAGGKGRVGAEEGQLGGARRRLDQHLGVGGDDAARDRAVIGRDRTDAALGKAGARALVEGEGGAARIGEAGGLAGVERGVEEAGQIAAGKVDIARDDGMPVGNGRGGEVLGLGRGRGEDKPQREDDMPHEDLHQGTIEW